MILSTVLGLAAGVAGILLSYHLGLAAGAAIAACMVVAYLVAIIQSGLRSLSKRAATGPAPSTGVA